MTWLMPKDPRHGRVGSQDRWQEEEGEGQRPPYMGQRDTGKVVKLSCLCSKAICREIIPWSTDTCTHVHVHTSPELQRRAPCGGQRAGSGQPGFHGSSGPAGNDIATAFPPERLPDSHSGPPGAGLHYEHPLRKQKAQALKVFPSERTARQPTEEVKPTASGQGPGPAQLLLLVPERAPCGV